MGNETTTTTEATDVTLETSVPQSETDTTKVESDETSETTTANHSSTEEELRAQIKRMEAALQKSNRDAKSHRVKGDELSAKISELEKFKAQVEAEKLSDQEKQEIARKTLEQKLAETQKLYNDTVLEKQEIKVRHALQLQAARLGVEPDVAEKLIDRAEIEHDDDGNPTNISSLLADLIKKWPYLVKANGRQAPTTSGGATNPPRSTMSAVSTASEYIKRMEQGKLSDSEYSALPASMKHEIQAELIKTRSRRR